MREYMKKYNAENRDRVREIHKKSEDKHKDKIKKRYTEYRKRPEVKERHKQWRQDKLAKMTPEELKEYKRKKNEYSTKYYWEVAKPKRDAERRNQ